MLTEVAATYVERVLDTDGPRVVVLDDLQWLDTSSTGMVEILVATAAVRPLVLLATTRPGVIPSWATLAHVERVDLDGLAPAETAQLATMVARAALDAGDARRIHERTQGNPLFIGETVRASMEDGTLELRDGRMVLIEPGAPRLPLTLRAVLGARLDGLDEPARDVLSVASVVGIGFRRAELEDLLGVPIAPGTLERLVDAALIVPSAGSGTWRFSHPLVHETAYAGMLASRRRRLHARLADRWRRVRRRSRSRRWRSTAPRPATRSLPSRCSSRPRRPLSPLAPRTRRPASGGTRPIWPQNGRHHRYRAAADAALQAARARRQAPRRRPPTSGDTVRVRPRMAGRIHGPAAAHWPSSSARRAGGEWTSRAALTPAFRARSIASAAVRWPRSGSSSAASCRVASTSRRSAPRANSVSCR